MGRETDRERDREREMENAFFPKKINNKKCDEIF
jgi:hypothetical protein